MLVCTMLFAVDESTTCRLGRNYSISVRYLVQVCTSYLVHSTCTMFSYIRGTRYEVPRIRMYVVHSTSTS